MAGKGKGKKPAPPPPPPKKKELSEAQLNFLKGWHLSLMGFLNLFFDLYKGHEGELNDLFDTGEPDADTERWDDPRSKMLALAKLAAEHGNPKPLNLLIAAGIATEADVAEDLKADGELGEKAEELFTKFGGMKQGQLETATQEVIEFEPDPDGD